MGFDGSIIIPGQGVLHRGGAFFQKAQPFIPSAASDHDLSEQTSDLGDRPVTGREAGETKGQRLPEGPFRLGQPARLALAPPQNQVRRA